MEPIGTFSDGEWDYFRRMFSTDEQFLSQSSLLLSEDVDLNNESMFYSFNDHSHDISNSQYISQENSYNSSNCSSDNNGVFIANHDHTDYYPSYPDDNNVLANTVSMDFYMDEKNFASSVPSHDDIVMEEDVKLNEDAGNGSNHRLEMPTVFPNKQLQKQLKRKLDLLEMEVLVEDNINNKSENPKKKSRSLKDGQGCMKNGRSKKNQKVGSCNEEEKEENTNTGSNRQSSSCNISEDDSASHENNGGATSGSAVSALNSSGKTRASRGSATDPQSLYAKKRRERINERLRILQNLVPNGTKVDISTMLEEAVNYVKFLQLQIKLLSSDDLWMYAPLAYNGLGIGLNLNLSSSPQLYMRA